MDSELLRRARSAHGGATDASVVEAAFRALMREHTAAKVDAQYLEAYRRLPFDTPDDWGDLPAFLDSASRS